MPEVKSVNPDSTFRSPGSFADSTASKPTWISLSRWCKMWNWLLHKNISQDWAGPWTPPSEILINNSKGLKRDILWFMLHLPLEQGEGNMRWVMSQCLFSKMAWVGWSLMIPSRRKAEFVLRDGIGLALHAWIYRQLHNGRGNNGKEIKKQSARKSFLLVPSVWAKRPQGVNLQRTQCCEEFMVSAANRGAQSVPRLWPSIFSLRAFGSVWMLPKANQPLDSFVQRSQWQGRTWGWWWTLKQIPNFCSSPHNRGQMLSKVPGDTDSQSCRKGMGRDFGQATRQKGSLLLVNI